MNEAKKQKKLKIEGFRREIPVNFSLNNYINEHLPCVNDNRGFNKFE